MMDEKKHRYSINNVNETQQRMDTNVIITKCGLKQCHPGAEITAERTIFCIWMAFVKEVKCLRKTKQHDHVDDTKRKHVTRDHGEDHRHKRTSQSDGSGKDIAKDADFFLFGKANRFSLTRQRTLAKTSCPELQTTRWLLRSLCRPSCAVEYRPESRCWILEKSLLPVLDSVRCKRNR